MIISPRSTHSFRVLVVRYDIVVIGKLFVADRADPTLLEDLAVHQFPHFGWRPEFPVSARMMRIVDSLNSEPYKPRLGNVFPPAARTGMMDRAILIAAEPHGDLLEKLRNHCGWPEPTNWAPKRSAWHLRRSPFPGFTVEEVMPVRTTQELEKTEAAALDRTKFENWKLIQSAVSNRSQKKGGLQLLLVPPEIRISGFEGDG